MLNDEAPATGEGFFYAALRAFALGDFAAAEGYAAEAALCEPGRRVFAAGAAYLARVLREGREQVYVSGEAFGAFIRGGGNIGLYKATSAALRAVYDEYASLRLLDVGVGDGLALLPALSPSVASVQLVEPSAAMLARTLAALRERNIAVASFEGALQAFMREAPPSQPWDVAQATYSLQSIPPAEREAALAWLRANARRLLLVEFDPPAACLDTLDPACVAYVLGRYEQGLAEYADDGGLVAQGFLMPIMFSYVDPTAARTNYERPLAAWEDDLRRAGFATLRRHKLFPYWWADAYLLDAS